VVRMTPMNEPIVNAMIQEQIATKIVHCNPDISRSR